MSVLNKRNTLFIACALAFGLAGCGGEKSAEKPADKPAAAANGKQEIIIANGTEPDSLDPHKMNDMPSAAIISQMMEGLVVDGDEGQIVPGMAERWETSEDGKVWTFHLRDAKWSNGDPVTAEDFVYSFQRMADPKTGSPNAYSLMDAKILNIEAILDGKAKPETLGVKALDAKTLQITLSRPLPYFLDLVGGNVPLHRKTVETFGDKWTAPENIVVNGSHKLKEWVVNGHVVLERNPLYYDNDKVKIDKATILPIAAPADLSRYKAGEIDVSYDSMPSEQFQSLKTEYGDEMKVLPSRCVTYYEVNVDKAPMNDVRVRRALSMTLDRELMAEKIAARGEKAAYQFTPASITTIKPYAPEWKDWSKEQRIAEAKKLLNEAGYNENNPLTFDLLYNTGDSTKRMTTAVSQLWKEALGFVEVKPLNQEFKTSLQTRSRKEHAMAYAAWCVGYNDPSSALSFLTANSSANWTNMKSKEFDDLLEKALEPGLTAEQRAEIYNQAEAVLVDKEAAVMPLFSRVSNRLIKPYVHGYPLKNPNGSWKLSKLSVDAH